MKMCFTGLLLLLLCAGCATQNPKPQSSGTSVSSKTFSGAAPLEWSRRLADSEMTRRSNSLAWKPEDRAKWDYTAGLFTLSLLKLNDEMEQWRDTVYPSYPYVEFVKNSIGSFITDKGEIRTYNHDEFQLDALNPGKTLLALYQNTRDPRYAAAALTLRAQLESQPRTYDGGFWHKQRYTNQMWLDGIYMAAPFYAECGKEFGDSTVFNDATKQIFLIDQHTYDLVSGLNYHGWDAAKVQPWANPATGCSSNFWGRAEGWYAMALVDILDYLPTNHPARGQVIAILQKAAGGIVKWQDPQTGLWWQVMDQGDRKGNYLEATASSMFVYALAKGVNHGYLPQAYIPAVEKGYAGIIQNLIQPDGNNRWSLTHCCAVAGLGQSSPTGKSRDGSFNYYVSEPVISNDLKGVGPFILAGIQMQKLASPATSTNIQ